MTSIAESEAATLPDLVAAQRAYFQTDTTRDVGFRKEQLRKLRDGIRSRESALLEALYADLHKSGVEAYSAEIGIVYREINLALRKLRSWAKPRRVRTDIFNLPGSGRVLPEPYGVSVIIAPWNYPFQLLILPLVGAIAAGNTAVIKPSEFAPRTASVVAEMIATLFPREYLSAVQGEAEVSRTLTSLPVDYIFYTGSKSIGAKVMGAAAERLTPLTLELGGKSPTIVDASAKLDRAARQIIFGKTINAGQTCVAPDYVLVHTSAYEPLLRKMVEVLGEFYDHLPKEHPRYARIVNERHFDRLVPLIDENYVYHGGDRDREDRYIEPTIMAGMDLDHPVMEDEIFGPILPVFPYEDLDEVVEIVRARPKPLALYLFTESRAVERRVLRSLSFGGGAVNATIMHVASRYLPFGGVGPSGMGRYHGKASFDTFSHLKAVLRQPGRFDHGLAYPNSRAGLSLLRRILR
jgi:aldehyde dehydrogenase (NAD+)